MNTRRSFIAMLMLATFMAILPSAVSAQGNSQNARACQDGGYLSYTDADGNGFRNVGQCMSYAAQGNTLHEPLTESVSLTWYNFPPIDDGSYCGATVTVTGFPDGSYPVTVTLSPDGDFPGGDSGWHPTVVVSDGSGSVSSWNGEVGSSMFRSGHTWTATVNGVSSAPTESVC